MYIYHGTNPDTTRAMGKNGWVKVSALELKYGHEDKMVFIDIINSKGNRTYGGIHLSETSMDLLCQAWLDSKDMR